MYRTLKSIFLSTFIVALCGLAEPSRGSGPKCIVPEQVGGSGSGKCGVAHFIPEQGSGSGLARIIPGQGSGSGGCG